MKSLVRYAPRSLDLLDDFDRIFNSVFDVHADEVVERPSVDIRETEDRYILEAELPGHTEKDVDIKLDDSLLTISAKKDEKSEEKRNGYILRERRTRSFNRSFVLPRDVDRDRIEANFANGLLTIELHKSEEAKPRQIEVKTGKKTK